MSITSEGSSTPLIPQDSPGSSVSSSLQEEYDELLKYAVVMPSYDPGNLPKTLADMRGSFPYQQQATSEEQESDDDNSTVVDTDEARQADDELPKHEKFRDPHSQSTPMEHTPQAPVLPKQYPPLNLSATDKKLAHVLFDEGESNRSSLSTTESDCVDRGVYTTTAAVDPDIGRMEGLMDTWTYDLKRNVLAEFGKLKIHMMQQYKSDVQRQKEKTAADSNRLAGEMEGLKELLHTYEQSIERKDQVIGNLTRAMQHQRDRFDMLRTFSEWKIRHNDAKREPQTKNEQNKVLSPEYSGKPKSISYMLVPCRHSSPGHQQAFASNLARKHYERSLAQRAWIAWHGIVECKWKNRVEKACQTKAQEVCMQLTNDYEARLTSLNEALEAAREEVHRLHGERDRYEETMKKAFMRGVCALNMEAMNMFHEAEKEGGTEEEEVCGTQQLMTDPLAPPPGMPATIYNEPVYNMEPPGAPASRVLNSQAAIRGQNVISHTKAPPVVKGRTVGKSKTLSTKLTARSDSGRSSLPTGGSNVPMGLAPPMSSVLVERHQPVTKQTIGHATAQQYPRNTNNNRNQSSIMHRKIAGQAGNIPLATPNVQTVKVVE